MENSAYEWKYCYPYLHYVHVETSKSVAKIDMNVSVTSISNASYDYEGDTYFDLDKLKVYVEAKIARNNSRQGIVPR